MGVDSGGSKRPPTIEIKRGPAVSKLCAVFVCVYFTFLDQFYQSLFSRTRYENLREDFQFNLTVLDERDQELARYDRLTAKAVTVNQNRYRFHILYKAQSGCVGMPFFPPTLFYLVCIIPFEESTMATCSSIKEKHVKKKTDILLYHSLVSPTGLAFTFICLHLPFIVY